MNSTKWEWEQALFLKTKIRITPTAEIMVYVKKCSFNYIVRTFPLIRDGVNSVFIEKPHLLYGSA
jgi:hypothetical protein